MDVFASNELTILFVLLPIQANETKEIKVDFNPEFVKRMIPKMDWPALVDAATSIGVQVPLEAPTTDDEQSMQQIHHAIFEVEVIEGELICPETGRKFPIKNGIPNMLCNEDEV